MLQPARVVVRPVEKEIEVSPDDYRLKYCYLVERFSQMRRRGLVGEVRLKHDGIYVQRVPWEPPVCCPFKPATFMAKCSDKALMAWVNGLPAKFHPDSRPPGDLGKFSIESAFEDSPERLEELNRILEDNRARVKVLGLDPEKVAAFKAARRQDREQCRLGDAGRTPDVGGEGCVAGTQGDATRPHSLATLPDSLVAESVIGGQQEHLVSGAGCTEDFDVERGSNAA